MRSEGVCFNSGRWSSVGWLAGFLGGFLVTQSHRPAGARHLFGGAIATAASSSAFAGFSFRNTKLRNKNTNAWRSLPRTRYDGLSGASRQRFALNTARSKRTQIRVSRARFGSRKAKGRPRGWPRGFIGLKTASKGIDPVEAGIPFGVSIDHGSVSRWRGMEGERWLAGPDRQW